MRHLPPATTLITAVRQHGPGILDQHAPAIDELTDTAGAAAYLGIHPRSIRRDMTRTRADGTRMFPPPDRVFGRSPAWSYRTIILARAAAPGRGGATRWQPGQSGRTARARDQHPGSPGGAS